MQLSIYRQHEVLCVQRDVFTMTFLLRMTNMFSLDVLRVEEIWNRARIVGILFMTKLTRMLVLRRYSFNFLILRCNIISVCLLGLFGAYGNREMTNFGVV